ncbi:hypothetical protein NLI96_g351 [Meripilus lineatus]|uniref:PWWP domain-containing protein n=1 Tax=Meripilus lineatus TaxID=2056292 RepID=A0AAD5VGM9_9APHY|nr:hypothetical protein NLI96_g351 [Physisporinus lineatus]
MSKKGSKEKPKEQSYDVRDVVLAKVRGFPPWPGMSVRTQRARKVSGIVSGSSQLATSKSLFSVVGPFYTSDVDIRLVSSLFPNYSAWLVPKDISKLQKHEIQAYIEEPFKRSGDLLAGYRIALDPTKWEEEREAASAEAAEEEANAEIDQLDSDGPEDGDAMDEDEDEEDEEGSKKKPKSKKRKRESEGGASTAKKAAAKGGRKKDSAEPAPKKKGTGKGKKNGAKSKAMVESEDEAHGEADEEDVGPSKKAASPPPAKKAKRDKDEDEVDPELMKDPEAQKVRDWRHKLQKAFLNTKVQQPKDEDMPHLDELFTTVENYDKMSVSYLSFSKIGKVMRHIHALPAEKVPRDEEFKFRERANVLVLKWHDIINANKNPSQPQQTNGDSGTNSGSNTAPVSTKPSANGKSDASPPSAGKKDSKASANGNAAKEPSGMDVDAKAEQDPEVAGDAAEANTVTEDTVVGDESVLADVTMSEAAA